MTKEEILSFEKDFTDIFKQKRLTHENWNQSRIALLKTFRELRIYDVIRNPKAILSRFASAKIVFVNQAILGDSYAMFLPTINTICLNMTLVKKPKLDSSFIHELLHCLTCERKIVVNKENKDDRMKYYDKTNVGIGIEEGEINCNPKSSKIKTGLDFYNIIVNNEYQGQTIDWTDDVNVFDGLNEGLTNLLHEIAVRKLRPFPLPLVGYPYETKVAAQFVSIFGQEAWSAFFNNDISGVGKKLGISNERVAKIISYLDEALEDFEDELDKTIDDLDSAEKADEILEREDLDSLYIFSNEKLMQAQIDLLALFERKMMKEIYETRHMFDNGNDIRKALMQAYDSYTRMFSHITEDFYTDNQIQYFNKCTQSIKRCEKFANTVLKQINKSPMQEIHDEDYRYFAIENNEQTYPVILCDGKEISLKDHIYGERKLSEVKLTADSLNYAKIVSQEID